MRLKWLNMENVVQYFLHCCLTKNIKIIVPLKLRLSCKKVFHVLVYKWLGRVLMSSCMAKQSRAFAVLYFMYYSLGTQHLVNHVMWMPCMYAHPNTHSSITSPRLTLRVLHFAPGGEEVPPLHLSWKENNPTESPSDKGVVPIGVGSEQSRGNRAIFVVALDYTSTIYAHHASTSFQPRVGYMKAGLSPCQHVYTRWGGLKRTVS